jgi:hypothetical protein
MSVSRSTQAIIFSCKKEYPNLKAKSIQEFAVQTHHVRLLAPDWRIVCFFASPSRDCSISYSRVRLFRCNWSIQAAHGHFFNCSISSSHSLFGWIAVSVFSRASHDQIEASTSAQMALHW